MNRESLFRLALVSHSHAPKTLNKYIALLAKLVVVESSESNFTANAISKLIKHRFNLEFLDEEIKRALKLDREFENTQDKKYCLKLEALQTIKDTVLNTKTLEHYLNEFLELFYVDRQSKEKNRIKEIIMQYIYDSFNSGRNSLVLLLADSPEKRISEDFNASDKDKKIINEFLDWDNPSKNECIYSIVSYCLDYGMLTTKKDVDSYKKFFEGVRFYLDSNIILRLIGMNNLERQEVIQHFVNKCKEVGIGLCYTNFTFQEIYYVIDIAVKDAMDVNNGDEPIAPSDLIKLGEYDRDFYEIYYTWCREDNNRYDDYEAYRAFLKQKVNSCLDGFIQVDQINAEFTSQKEEFLSLSKGLMEFKNQRNPTRPCSFVSAKTDVNNLLFVKNNNSDKDGCSLNTKGFFISADRRFYNWVITLLPGVPLVFLPSEWLSIILKYTSRTDSDYTTFCKFMNLRFYHSEKQKQQAMQRIHSINELTSDVEVKRKIINEINEISLSLPEEHFEEEEEIVKKAFDIVLEEQRLKSTYEINKRLEEKEKEFEQQFINLQLKTSSEVNYAKIFGAEEAATTIAITSVDKKMVKWIWIKDNIIQTDFLVGVLSFLLLFLVTKISTIENAIIRHCATSKLLIKNELTFSFVLIASSTAVIVLLINIFFNYMGLSKRRENMIKREKAKYIKMLEKQNHYPENL
jgi:hypothetical protein